MVVCVSLYVLTCSRTIQDKMKVNVENKCCATNDLALSMNDQASFGRRLLMRSGWGLKNRLDTTISHYQRHIHLNTQSYK